MISIKKLLFIFVIIHGVSAYAINRFSATLDNGVQITVDNASNYSNSWVNILIVAADRSTVDDCPFNSPDFKGLMHPDDRVFISDYYIAWFDMSLEDGVDFANSRFAEDRSRGGALTGYWSLDPQTENFKYMTTGPNNCFNWPRNELVIGSASPNGEENFWDKYAPPIEHTIVSSTIQGEVSKRLFSHNLAQNSPNSEWALSGDGVVVGNDVHYLTTAYMSNAQGNIDLSDGDDSNGILNKIKSKILYNCREREIICSWIFKPIDGPVVAENLYVYIWSDYTPNGIDCKNNVDEPAWPTGSSFLTQNFYVQSNLATEAVFNQTITNPIASGSITHFEFAPPCVSYNNDLNTIPRPGNSSWIRVGASPTLNDSERRWLYINSGIPGTGSGTESDPIFFQFERLFVAQETRDGVMGFSAANGPWRDSSDYIHLSSTENSWNIVKSILTTNY